MIHDASGVGKQSSEGLGALRGVIMGAFMLPLMLALSFAGAARGQSGGDRSASTVERGVDPSIAPGDDFFAYANGVWLKTTDLPAGKDRWTNRNEIEITTRRQIDELFDGARTATPGSAARKVADFRAAYLDRAAIDAKGIAPLALMFADIDRVRDKGELTRLLGRGMRADVDPLNQGVYESSHVLGLSVEESIHGEKNNVAFLLEGGLGLPNRDDYMSPDAAKQSLRNEYQGYIARQLAQAGFDRAEERAAAVMVLETSIARSHATSEASAVDHNADNPWTRADFARLAPGMDWSAFLDAAGLAKEQTLVAWQPTALTGLAALVAAQSLDAWKDYLRFHVIDRYADVLPSGFDGQSRALRRVAAGGRLPDSTRDERALAATQLALSDAIGKMYAERYLPAAQKARLQRIVDNVSAAFQHRVEAVTWMSPATKTLALAKLKKLYVGLGYPEHWQDFSDLKVDATDPVGNRQRVAEREYRRALARLGKPLDAREWWIAPQTPGGILVFQQNQYEVSAALLQPPRFDASASDAATYGAIGVIIGHDVTHFVDVLGAEYDLDGAMHLWRTPEDTTRFAAVAEPLVKQFSSYKPFPDASMNGKLAETENVADLGGLAAAFDAYRSSLGARARDREYVRQQDREFFLGFAQSMRAKYDEAGLRKQLANDHAPEAYRVATVRNLDAWYDAFDVRPGQRLYVEPGARVKIW